MVTKKQSKNCYSEKINYVFCYKQCLGVFHRLITIKMCDNEQCPKSKEKKKQNRSRANTNLYKN